MFGFDGRTILNAALDTFPGSTGFYCSFYANTPCVTIKVNKNQRLYNLYTASGMRQVSMAPYFVKGNIYVNQLLVENGKYTIIKKNELLATNTLSLMATTSTCDKNWLITKENSKNFIAYLIAENGEIERKVVSGIGIDTSFDVEARLSFDEGVMKMNRAGSKLAVSYGSLVKNSFFIYDFDKASGVLSNPTTVQSPDSIISVGSIEFASDESSLFIEENGSNFRQIIKIENPSDLLKLKRTLIKREGHNGTTGDPYKANYLAPDGNLYYIHNTVLERYNENTEKIEVVQDKIFSSFSFPHDMFEKPYTIKRQTYHDTIYKCTQEIVNLYPEQKMKNTTWNNTVMIDSLKVKNEGRYTIIGEIGDCTYYDTVYVKNRNIPPPQNTKLSLCESSSLVLKPSQLIENIVWQDKLVATEKTITNEGVYLFSGYYDRCEVIDSFVITKQSVEKYSINDTLTCKDNSIEIQLDSNLKNIKWSDGDTLSVRSLKSGLFSYQATVNSCVVRDTFKIEPISYDKSFLENISVCYGEQLPIFSNVTWFNQTKPIDSSQFVNFTYQITKTCTINDSIKVTLRTCKECEITLSNVVLRSLPVIKFYSTCDLRNATFLLFDRWGNNMVTRSIDSTNSINIDNSKALASGVYIYKIIKQDESSTSLVGSGDILIME